MAQHQINDDVRAYLRSLLIDTGFKGLADDEEAIQELFIRLDNYLSTVILNHLPKHRLEEYVGMVEQGRPKKEIEQFLVANLVPGAEEVFRNAFIDFRSLFLGKMAKAKAERLRDETHGKT